MWKVFKRASDAFFKTQEPFSEFINTGVNFNVAPSITHNRLYYYYLTDPGIQNAVNTFLDQVFGVGWHLTADDDKALEKVNNWFKKIHFKKKLKIFGKDALITGNGMFEKIETEGMKPKLIDLDVVDMRIVKEILTDRQNPRVPGTVVQQIGGLSTNIQYSKIVHLKLFELSRQFFGIGLFHSLAVPQYEQDGELISILDDMRKLREAFPRIVKRYASPTKVFLFPDEDEAHVKEEGLKYKQAKQGEDIFTNKDFVYKELTLDPRSRFDRYIDWIQLVYDVGTQTPAAKLMTTPGFTEASSKSALELVERRIRGIQEDTSIIIEEEIITPFLLGEGLDPEKANIQFQFGLPDVPDFSLEDVFRACTTIVENKPLMTWKEGRHALAKIFEIDPDSAIEESSDSFTIMHDGKKYEVQRN